MVLGEGGTSKKIFMCDTLLRWASETCAVDKVIKLIYNNFFLFSPKPLQDSPKPLQRQHLARASGDYFQ